MLPKQFVSLFRNAILLALPLLVSGCLFFGQGDSRGVRLSDAMKSAAKGDRRDLGGTSSSGTYRSDDSGSAVFASAVGWGASYQDSEYDWQMLADVAHARPFNGDIKGLTHFTMTPASLENDHNFFGVYVGGAIVEFESGSLPDLATKCPWMLEAGLAYRRYLNHPRTFLSPYFTARVGYQMLAWDYRNPIVVGNETIHGDFLNGVEGYVGFGVSTMRDSHWGLFGEVGVGGTAFLGATNHGFDNDVFEDFAFVSFKVGLSIKF